MAILAAWATASFDGCRDSTIGLGHLAICALVERRREDPPTKQETKQAEYDQEAQQHDAGCLSAAPSASVSAGG